jgi:hypothetical protein
MIQPGVKKKFSAAPLKSRPQRLTMLRLSGPGSEAQSPQFNSNMPVPAPQAIVPGYDCTGRALRCLPLESRDDKNVLEDISSNFLERTFGSVAATEVGELRPIGDVPR